MTLDFLFELSAVSRISVLRDMQTPKANDNTHRTYAAYLPLVAACRPDWDKTNCKAKNFLSDNHYAADIFAVRNNIEDVGY